MTDHSPGSPAPNDELERLNTRVKKLAMEKSWLQFIITLMGNLSATAGLDQTVDNILRNLVDFLGGTNAALYYFVDEQIRYVDVFGRREVIAHIDDALVQEALETRQMAETQHSFEDTRMVTAPFTQAWTVAFPLYVGDETIGVCQIWGMHLTLHEITSGLPPLFNHIALLLRSEIFSHTRLMHAYDQLEEANTALHAEIAERARFETALKRAKEEAEAANRAKSLFLANMSHELRTPMNAVIGFSQLMRRDRSLGEEQRANVETIERSGRHLLSLINDVLEISKIEAGRMQVEQSVFDLKETLDATVEMMAVRANAKGISLSLDYDVDAPSCVTGDATKVRQILFNLVGNAVKFTERGGVLVRVFRCDEALPDGIEFDIVDTGCGVSQEELARIFEAFYQTPDAARRGEGTGLGLAISREYARLMGGSIDALSEPGKGSTFRVRLPLPKAERTTLPVAEGREVAAIAPGQPAFRILVVEDREENRRLLVRLLESVGFQVHEACDGAEGLKAFHAWRPHFIWMDMRMPIMDGYEATRRIKETREGAETFIVALTASAFEEDRDKVLAAGCDGFMRKPLSAREVFATLQRFLGVEYIYADEEQTAKPPARPLSPERVAAVPPELVADLVGVAVACDLQGVRAEIARLAGIDASLAEEVGRLADLYRFDEILRLFEGAEGRA